ncbi:mRNA splicing protein [Orbilia blumenaviensis]|uniref:Pre-mRNA-splicing factor SLU7 n=1 Tax=Orbilia blumenaviensis TaxID=1796055 RepID=A0AAV9ULC1_9PEZI
MSRRHANAQHKGIPKSDPNSKGVSSYKNEYIPNFISKKPFWLNEDSADSSSETTDYLEHQRLQKKKADDLNLLEGGDKWYDRGKKLGPAATKFRKGACENCGSMGHQKKDCLQRIRKKGAKFSGVDIAQDEEIQKLELGWDGKRDRWNGYDPREHDNLIEEFARMEELRAQQKSLENGNGGTGTGLDGEDEEDKYAEESNMPGQTYDSSSRVTTRNLRIREDTAKYLLNLDLDSAKYDPKTRTMVDGGALSDQAAKLVAEEGFMRSSGDAAEFERAQKVAWESREKGIMGAKMHLQANPTEGEILRKKLETQKDDQTQKKRQALLDKYGGGEYLQAPPKGATVTESERYIEYSESGDLVKGKADAVAKSKYPEDVYINNHTSVWGSWWQNFKWGYACCHSFVKNSYCTGEEGKRGMEEAEKMRTGGDLEEQERKQIAWRKERQEAAEAEKDEEEEEPAHRKEEEEETAEDKKRKRDQMHSGVTEEELEQHRKRRLLADDPMANYVDSVV